MNWVQGMSTFTANPAIPESWHARGKRGFDEKRVAITAAYAFAASHPPPNLPPQRGEGPEWEKG